MMKTTVSVLLTAAITCGAMWAQNVVYQQAGAIGGVTRFSTGGEFGSVSSGFVGGRTVVGSPFSATEQRHSLQVLGDGSRIEQNSTSQISRDSEGRTREEIPAPEGAGPAMVTILDPVANVQYVLDPVRKSAARMPLLPTASIQRVKAALSGQTGTFTTSAPAPAGTSTAVADGPKKMMVWNAGPGQPGPAVYESAVTPQNEDLGPQSINGVIAKGSRATIVIPTGQIGNDRPLNVVNERWYSDELGMVVKSSNADPRFGTTTYELTNISRAQPDPSLFQIPSDYTLNEEKGVFNFKTGPAPAK